MREWGFSLVQVCLFAKQMVYWRMWSLRGTAGVQVGDGSSVSRPASLFAWSQTGTSAKRCESGGSEKPMKGGTRFTVHESREKRTPSEEEVEERGEGGGDRKEKART